MSPIANVKYCLEAACLSMLKQTRSPDVANCSNFHLVWVSWWTSVAPGTQNCQTWKKSTSIFLHMTETLKTTISGRFFTIPGRNSIKSVCSDTLFHCKFCCKIRIWSQFDSGNFQRCQPLFILANFSRFYSIFLQKYIFLGIFEHCRSPIDLKFWF